MAAEDDNPPISTPSPEPVVVPPVEAAPAASASPPSPAQSYPTAPPPAYHQPVYRPTQPQGLSVASMTTGIVGAFLSLFSLGFLPALAGVITGHIASKRQPQAKPLWLTGVITGYVGIGLSLLWGIFWIFWFILIIGIGVGASQSGNYSY